LPIHDLGLIAVLVYVLKFGVPADFLKRISYFSTTLYAYYKFK